MERIEYFKLQAKNLLRDFKTQFVDEENDGIYDYKPRFFDVNEIVLSFDVDEDEPFTLMNAQHIIARLAGFQKWTELIKASEAALEIGKLLLDNRDETGGIMTNIAPSVIVEDWENYYQDFLMSNGLETVNDETKLDVFKQGFLGRGVSEEDCIHNKTRGNAQRTQRKKLTKEYYLKNNPFGGSSWDTHVECLHCGERYLFNNAEVDELGLIVCPTEDCDGSMIDMMPV